MLVGVMALIYTILTVIDAVERKRKFLSSSWNVLAVVQFCLYFMLCVFMFQNVEQKALYSQKISFCFSEKIFLWTFTFARTF